MGKLLGSTLGTTLGTSLGTNLCPGAAAAPVLTPSDIFAAGERRAWFRADQGIVLNGSRVSGWGNLWGGGEILAAGVSVQPLYDATGIRGLPAIVNDDGARRMTGTLTSGFAIGTRMYLWVLVKVVTLGADFRYGWQIGSSGSDHVMSGALHNTNNWRAMHKGAGGTTVSADTGHAVSLGNPTLCEGGMTTSGTASVVISGTPYSYADVGAVAASTQAAMSLFCLNQGTAQGIRGAIAECVATTEPTAQQKADMRTYFRARYGSI